MVWTWEQLFPRPLSRSSFTTFRSQAFLAVRMQGKTLCLAMSSCWIIFQLHAMTFRLQPVEPEQCRYSDARRYVGAADINDRPQLVVNTCWCKGLVLTAIVGAGQPNMPELVEHPFEKAMSEVVVDGWSAGDQEGWLWRIPPHLVNPLQQHVGPLLPLIGDRRKECLGYPADNFFWQAVPPFGIDGILGSWKKEEEMYSKYLRNWKHIIKQSTIIPSWQATEPFLTCMFCCP